DDLLALGDGDLVGGRVALDPGVALGVDVARDAPGVGALAFAADLVAIVVTAVEVVDVLALAVGDDVVEHGLQERRDLVVAIDLLGFAALAALDLVQSEVGAGLAEHLDDLGQTVRPL